MSPHADARRVLARWSPPDARQSALRDDFVAHLDAHPDGDLRTCRDGHVTASALLVDPAARTVMLTNHAVVGRWLQLGGHCEPGDATLHAAVRRELVEESGLPDDAIDVDDEPAQLDRHRVRCRSDGVMSELHHLDVQFLATASSRIARGATADPSEWFGWDAPPPGLDSAVLGLVAAARERHA